VNQVLQRSASARCGVLITLAAGEPPAVLVPFTFPQQAGIARLDLLIAKPRSTDELGG